MTGKLKKNLILIAIIIAGVLIGGTIIYTTREKNKGAEPAALVSPEGSSSEEGSSLANLAKCLDEKGAKFYGAYWCGWCKKQKEIFGEDQKHLPYIECIDEKTQKLTSECQTAGISGFPTWEFQGKGKTPGFKTLEQLVELSGCSL